MIEPLEELFFSSSLSLTRPIDLIIYDIFVPMIPEIAHRRQISVHAFVPNSLTAIRRFIDISIGVNIKSIINEKLAKEMIKSLWLVDGIICNSIYELDKQVLDELHQKLFLQPNIPIRFIAPLMAQANESVDVSFLYSEIISNLFSCVRWIL